MEKLSPVPGEQKEEIDIQWQQEPLLHMKGKGGIDLSEVVAAYRDCQRHKRSTKNALKFEYKEAEGCSELCYLINSGLYEPGRSIAFIVKKPVIREVFAADFRDRIVHHLITMKIQPILESLFIQDNYSTRPEKGTLYGIKRVSQMIYQCSDGYVRDCYVMKVDIKGFFMAIDKQMLYDGICQMINKYYHQDDIEQLLWLIHTVIFNRPEKGCILRSSEKDWEPLPKEKSLRNTDGTHGLPIGNLTSQLFALYFLNPLDHIITEEWQQKLVTPLYYGRYVDDMVFVHQSKQVLITFYHQVNEWLLQNKQLLHPKKFYLQHYSKGVLFVGGMILPGRVYVGHRTLANFVNTIMRFNKMAENEPSLVLENIEQFRATVNSYLGILGHMAAYNVTHRIIRRIHSEWYKYMYIESKKGKMKVVVKKQYLKRYRLMKKEVETPLSTYYTT